MADSREAEQQTEQETIDAPKPCTRLDRFISHEGEMTITPPKPEKSVEEKPKSNEEERQRVKRH